MNVANTLKPMTCIIRLKERCMITTTVIVKVRPEKKAEFLQAMRSLQTEKMKEKGIRASEINEVEDRTGFCLTDEWETEEDRDRYCQAKASGSCSEP